MLASIVPNIYIGHICPAQLSFQFTQSLIKIMLSSASAISN